MDENDKNSNIKIILSGNSNHVIEINDDDDDDDDDIDYMNNSNNELTYQNVNPQKRTSFNEPQQNSHFDVTDQFFSDDDDLYDRAHKISNLIARALKSNASDPNIRKLQEKRRAIWLQIEGMESKIQNNFSNNSQLISQFVNPDENNDNVYDDSIHDPIHQNLIDQSILDESSYVYELYPEDHKCKDPKIFQIITEINKNYFHHDRFRGCQAAAIESALNGKDVFVIMPTGGGKSLIYQLSGFYQKNLTIVISPLISLIKDQVESLRSMGFNADSLTKDSTSKNYTYILNNIRNSQLFFLFLTPEKLGKSNSIWNFLQDLYSQKRITRFVIDEAHCISQWGHDFRVDYCKLSAIRERLPTVPIMALTATATKTVIQDVKNILHINDCDTYHTSFNRPNIIIEVCDKKEEKKKLILNYIRERNFQDKCGIIFCLTIDETEDVSQFLNEHGLNTRFYHGQIKDTRERHEIQRLWMEDKVKIIVATTAFGMGIDKPDVRFVIHHRMPKSIENYYQEIGRAGRDGQLSYCLLLYSTADRAKIMNIIFYGKQNNEDEISERSKSEYELIDSMSLYCMNKLKCRRAQIINYFGEEFDDSMCHNTCDNCINRETRLVKIDKIDEREAPKSLAKIVCRIQYKRPNTCPYPTINYIVSLFNGQKKKVLPNSGDDNFPEFGEGKKGTPIKDSILTQIAMSLVSCRILSYKTKAVHSGSVSYLIMGQDFEQYFNVEENPNSPGDVNITDKNVFFPEISVYVDNDKQTLGMNPVDEQLYRNLIKKREKIAIACHVADQTNISKASTLRAIVSKKPKDFDTLMEIGSVGLDEMNKLKKYGKEFVQTVIDSLAQQPPIIQQRPKSSPPKRPNSTPKLKTDNFNKSYSTSLSNKTENQIQPPQLSNSFNYPNLNPVQPPQLTNSFNYPNIKPVQPTQLANSFDYPNIKPVQPTQLANSFNYPNTKPVQPTQLTNNFNYTTQKVSKVNVPPPENNNDNEDDFSFLNDADFIEQQKKILESFERNKEKSNNSSGSIANTNVNANQNVVDLTYDDSDEGDADEATPLSKQRQSFFSRLKKSNDDE